MSSIRKVNVLVVDDVVFMQKIHSSMCKKFDCEVQVANNGKEAFELHGKGLSFDLILMDMQMPVMDGPTATKLIREMGNECMIVGVSSNDAEKRAFMNSGLDDFHKKPLSADDLQCDIHKVQREMEVHQMLASEEQLSVLIVGDDPVTHRLCKRIGCKTQMAKNGKEVVDLYEADRVSFDLIIVNKELSIMDDGTGGTTVTKELRESGVESMIVGISVQGGLTGPEKRTFKAAGLNELCTKPLTIFDLGTLLEKVIKNK